MQWHYEDRGSPVGPVSSQILALLLQTGEITSDTLVWRVGLEEWQKLSRADPDFVQGCAKPSITSSNREPNWIVRHWIGGETIARAFWLNGIGGFALLYAVLYGIVRSYDLMTENGFEPAPAFALMIAAAVVGTWQMIGVWRSANRALFREKNPVTALATKLAITALCILAALGVRDLTQIQNSMHELYKAEMAYRFTISDVPNSDSILISGSIGRTLARKLEDKLSSNQSIRRIVITSGGGLIAEAFKVASLIEDRKLEVEVVDNCSSACTIILMAGTKRIVRKGSKMGFHKPSNIIAAPDWTKWLNAKENPAEDQTNQYFAYLLAKGVSPDFVKRIKQYEGNEIYYAKNVELFLNGVASHVTDRD